MDSREQNQQYSSSNNASQGSANFPFNGPQTDDFHAFVNTDEGPGFDASWNSQAFPNHQPTIGGFDHGHQGWPPNPYQNSNHLPVPNYGVPSREFDQTYSRSPASFNYPAFEQDQGQSFGAPSFDNGLDYGQLPISDRFDFAGSSHYGQPNETISPQALQTYSHTSQTQVQQHRPQQNNSYGPSLGFAGGGSSGRNHAQGHLINQPLSHQDWINLSTPKSTSIYRGGLHIKPTDAFAKVTNSSRLDGFIFVGNSPLRLNTNQTPVQRHKRRKSRSEVSRLLQLERGDDRPHPDRVPILKRLKAAATKLAGPAPTPSRDSSTANSGSDTSDSESDDESEYSDSELEIAPEEPSPVPLARPADPNKAVEYDIIKTVWAKKTAVLSGTVIRTALTECWDIFLGVRDNWKKKNASLQQAIGKKDTANKNAYERRVVEQRRLLESCIRLTLKHGHPSIVEKLGENPKLLVVFYTFLADRIKEADYTGSFIDSILELTSRCTSIDASLLEQTKMDKVLPRFLKRGDAQGKALAQQILDSAAKAKTQKTSTGEATSGRSSTTNGATSTKQSRAASAESSKPRASTAKELASDGTSKALRLTSASKTAPPNGDNDTSKKAKTIPTVAKSSGFFAGLQSASKKPGTSNRAKDGKQSDSETKSEEAKPAPKPTFSFAATMANLQKQKEAPTPKPEDIRKPESLEEKQKRLRKEQRRKLRVSFKADGELVQIREFVHDPEEELGHEDSQMRDVGDSRGEGQMLKMHKDLDLMDEDEDYEPPEEMEPMPDWTTPHATDFSEIEDLEREKNYTARGGILKPDSQERKIQEQRESSTLMVVYTSSSDVPPSPREPPSEDSQMRVEEKKFGDPPPSTKARESEYRARISYAPTPPVAQPVPNIAAILARINGQSKAQPPPPQPQPPVNPTPALAGLQALIAQFGNNSKNQQQAPHFQVSQQQSVVPTFNLAATLANIGQPNHSQQPYQSQPSLGPSQPVQVDMQAILAHIKGTQTPAPQAPPVQGYGFTENTNPYPGDNDRKRQFDSDDEEEFGKGKKMRGESGKEKRPIFNQKTLPCRFFQEGKCRKGDECTFLHE